MLARAASCYEPEARPRYHLQRSRRSRETCGVSVFVNPFTSVNRRRKIASIEIPSHCGKGRPLTPDTVRIDQRERRWGCRQCGRERAAAFRHRQKRAA
jgi:hypothetical protein